MKSLFTAFSTLLLFALAVTVQAQDDDCPAGFKPVESPPGSGIIVCQKLTIVCPGTNRDYIDKKGDATCCPSSKNLTIFDNNRNGICCEKTQTVVNGECVPPLPPVLPPPPPPPTCPQCPQQPEGACALKAACGNSTHNGLQYGSCYTLVFPDGSQLSRGKHGHKAQYLKGDGHVKDIPFRVCQSTADCGTGPLANGDKFFLQDLIGGLSDGTGSPGWINNANEGTHLKMTHNTDKAGHFNGKTACSGTRCKCVVKLSGNGSGVGFACPHDEPGLTFWSNPRVTLDMQFVEIPCSYADPI